MKKEKSPGQILSFSETTDNRRAADYTVQHAGRLLLENSCIYGLFQRSKRISLPAKYLRGQRIFNDPVSDITNPFPSPISFVICSAVAAGYCSLKCMIIRL